MRHRLDLAKLYLGKDGGYSLRKFKRIFKREMEENPEKYMILQKGQSMDDLRVEKSDNEDELNDEDEDDEDNEKVKSKRRVQEHEQESASENENEEVEGEVVKDLEAEKAKWRVQAKKEIDEMNADSEDEHYTFEEEELEALLEQIEKETFFNDEEAVKFFEDHYQKLSETKFKWCKDKSRRNLRKSTHPMDKILDSNDPVESVI